MHNREDMTAENPTNLDREILITSFVSNDESEYDRACSVNISSEPTLLILAVAMYEI